MTEYKKLIYELEDTFALGKSLPLVALRQLPKIAEKFKELPDIPDYLPGTQKALSNGITQFLNECNKIIDDERELKEVFTMRTKLHHYSHYTLRHFETKNVIETDESTYGNTLNSKALDTDKEHELKDKEERLSNMEKSLKMKEIELQRKEKEIDEKKKELDSRDAAINKKEEELLKNLLEEEEKLNTAKWTVSECKRLSKLPRNSKEFQEGVRALYKRLTPVGVAHYSYIIDPLLSGDNVDR